MEKTTAKSDLTNGHHGVLRYTPENARARPSTPTS
jgi:hypothetical protein